MTDWKHWIFDKNSTIPEQQWSTQIEDLYHWVYYTFKVGRNKIHISQSSLTCTSSEYKSEWYQLR